jgi:hypothetical protein
MLRSYTLVRTRGKKAVTQATGQEFGMTADDIKAGGFDTAIKYTDKISAWRLFMRYRVEITEKLSRVFEVEASSSEQALNKIAESYWNEEIVVESNSGADVSFRVLI